MCGGLESSEFFPAGQQFYSASSGTSHSAPAVAGGAALVRQYFVNHGLTPPSPAMTKAFLVNSARYMTGTGANDTLPSNSQGMGMMNLDTYFSQLAGPRILLDQRPGDLFTASGQLHTFTGTVADGGQPLRVTLAWTDAPGPTVRQRLRQQPRPRGDRGWEHLPGQRLRRRHLHDGRRAPTRATTWRACSCRRASADRSR